MREFIALLLFLGGLGLGVAGAAYYYGDINASLQTSLNEVQSELDQVASSSAAERESLKQQLASAIETKEASERELEIAQAELAEQAATIARQVELLAAFGEKPDGEESSDAAQVDRPSVKPDGVVNGGQFLYRNVQWSLRDEDFEVVGELENRTKKQFTNAIFHVELFGEGSRSLGTVTVMINNFSPGKVIPFNKLALVGHPELYDSVRRFKITAALLEE